MKKLVKYIIMLTSMIVLTVCLSATAFAADIKSSTKSEIDITNQNDGYIKVHAKDATTKQLKVKTAYTRSDGTKVEYTYDLDGSGSWETYSLQSGNGKYAVTVLENVDGSRYSVVQTVSLDVKYSKDNAPFLIATQNVNYNDASQAVTKAKELCSGVTTDLEKVNKIYKYIVDNIDYDNDKAKQITSGEITKYLPSVDVTLDTGKGICFDYSSLLAAMLRSQGIPTKLVMGYVSNSPNPIYHAWSEVYIENVGWVKINSSVYFDGKNWSRMDSTFEASNTGGKNTKYIEADSNYSKSKEY